MNESEGARKVDGKKLLSKLVVKREEEEEEEAVVVKPDERSSNKGKRKELIDDNEVEVGDRVKAKFEDGRNR